MANKDYIETSEAAIRSGVTEATIRNWIRDFDIGIKVGGRFKVNVSKLKKILAGDLYYGKEKKKE